MKNSNEIELPEVNIERAPLPLLIFAGCVIGLVLVVYKLFAAMNPLGFVLMIPAAVGSFQLVWFLLTPFALVFKNRVELKRTLLSNKCWYFLDVSKANEGKKGAVLITYNDGEVESVNLFGIKKEHRQLFIEAFKKPIEGN